MLCQSFFGVLTVFYDVVRSRLLLLCPKMFSGILMLHIFILGLYQSLFAWQLKINNSLFIIYWIFVKPLGLCDHVKYISAHYHHAADVLIIKWVRLTSLCVSIAKFPQKQRSYKRLGVSPESTKTKEESTNRACSQTGLLWEVIVMF